MLCLGHKTGLFCRKSAQEVLVVRPRNERPRLSPLRLTVASFDCVVLCSVAPFEDTRLFSLPLPGPLCFRWAPARSIRSGFCLTCTHRLHRLLRSSSLTTIGRYMHIKRPCPQSEGLAIPWGRLLALCTPHVFVIRLVFPTVKSTYTS